MLGQCLLFFVSLRAKLTKITRWLLQKRAKQDVKVVEPMRVM